MLKIPFVKLAVVGLVGAGIACAGGAKPVQAVENETLAMRFDVFVKGLQVFELRYKTQFAGNAYRTDVKLEPTGFAGLFVDRKIRMSSSGSIGTASVVPDRFNYRSRKNKKKLSVDITWNKDGVAHTTRSRALVKYKANAVAKALRPRLPDPLATLLRAGISKSATPCKHSERVYNGQEVYDLKFQLVGKDKLGGSDGGVYRGPAYKCRMIYQPVAGLSKDKSARYRADPPVFTVWFAPVTSQVIGKPILVPVAATGQLKDKRFVAYANAATLSGRPLNSQSLASR